jgi:hypothetical protein
MACVVIIGCIVAFCVLLAVLDRIATRLAWTKLSAARSEYAVIVEKYGASAARDHCPHRVLEFAQTGVPGVITTTTKWCKVCGKHLGSAQLKTSIFGTRRWE